MQSFLDCHAMRYLDPSRGCGDDAIGMQHLMLCFLPSSGGFGRPFFSPGTCEIAAAVRGARRHRRARRADGGRRMLRQHETLRASPATNKANKVRVVPLAGLEPARPCGQQILSLRNAASAEPNNSEHFTRKLPRYSALAHMRSLSAHSARWHLIAANSCPIRVPSQGNRFSQPWARMELPRWLDPARADRP